MDMDILIIRPVLFAEDGKAQVQVSLGYHGLLILYVDLLRLYGDMGKLLIELGIDTHRRGNASLRCEPHGQAPRLIVGHAIRYIVGFLP